MRTSIAIAVAAAAATLITGCASSPTHYAAAADVPMYTPSEWTAMNTDQSVPEIPADETASNDSTIAGTTGFSGYYGGFRGFRNYNGASARGSFTPSYGRTTISAATMGSGSVSVGSSGHASSGGHGGGHGH